MSSAPAPWAGSSSRTADYDDSLDVVGVHLVDGVVGTVLIGGFAAASYTFLVTYGTAKSIDKVLGFRADEEHEHTGLDLTVHAETAYDHGVLGHGAPVTSSAPSTQKAKAQV